MPKGPLRVQCGEALFDIRTKGDCETRKCGSGKRRAQTALADARELRAAAFLTRICEFRNPFRTLHTCPMVVHKKDSSAQCVGAPGWPKRPKRGTPRGPTGGMPRFMRGQGARREGTAGRRTRPKDGLRQRRPPAAPSFLAAHDMSRNVPPAGPREVPRIEIPQVDPDASAAPIWPSIRASSAPAPGPVRKTTFGCQKMQEVWRKVVSFLHIRR